MDTCKNNMILKWTISWGTFHKVYGISICEILSSSGRCYTVPLATSWEEICKGVFLLSQNHHHLWSRFPFRGGLGHQGLTSIAPQSAKFSILSTSKRWSNQELKHQYHCALDTNRYIKRSINSLQKSQKSACTVGVQLDFSSLPPAACQRVYKCNSWGCITLSAVPQLTRN